ncbi:arginine/serine-rich coiled-coil protein 2-like isoform X2 [Hoplias malabaricus]|uniref:arginine/serine-rich coiled-coil protein 2-like isoform X2 n=1 Tax=Hoplias malabaricus TaxID=27720 RepID=UPI003462AAFB
MESSKSPRSTKHHSRSRSRSRERKRDKKHRRSRSRSKEARRRDSEKAMKLHSRSEDMQNSVKDRERLSEDSGEERHRRKERKSSRGRSQSRSRSRERRHNSKSREKRRSRSRERRSKSREKKRRAKSRSRSRSKHKRSRSRSKSRERKKRPEKPRRKSRSRSVSPVAFRGRNTAMDAQEALARRLERAKKLQEQKEKEMLEKQQHQQQEIAAVTAAAPLLADNPTIPTANPVLNVAALLASGTQVTPQIAMAAQMAALQAKTLAETGIAVPSYYNPSAVNPMKFAEQEKKRKLLWQGKKEGDKSQTAELWEKLNFGNKDQNVKFRKLMGIKEEEGGPSGAVNDEGLKTLQKQEEMFRNLDVQYEMARSQTHTQRGMGLGFSSSFSRGMDAV